MATTTAPSLASSQQQQLHNLHSTIQGIPGCPLLALLTAEIPWETLVELMTTKYYSVGQFVWTQGQVPTSVGFIMQGQFALQMKPEAVGSTPKSDKIRNPGACISAFPAYYQVPLAYSVMALSYKSSVLMLSTAKFKTILKQFSRSKERQILQLLETMHKDDLNWIEQSFPLQGDHMTTVMGSVSPMTRPIEYENTNGVLVIHEVVTPVSSKPRLDPICAKAKANMQRRLDQLHTPEHYNHLETHTGQRKHLSYLRRRANDVDSREKPVGRLLKPMITSHASSFVRAERSHPCEFRPLNSPSTSTPPRSQSTPSLFSDKTLQAMSAQRNGVSSAPSNAREMNRNHSTLLQ
ncbi:hypothetical protein LEN26_002870 [Aphanomyces euteiches]|nr:hypothetical protein AeMF1_006656 [Aphanomyces euteiches]KAH9158583.1 hypothetical protein LEN26_002870 [Aphanomyces euteiches]